MGDVAVQKLEALNAQYDHFQVSALPPLVLSATARSPACVSCSACAAPVSVDRRLPAGGGLSKGAVQGRLCSGVLEFPVQEAGQGRRFGGVRDAGRHAHVQPGECLEHVQQQPSAPAHGRPGARCWPAWSCAVVLCVAATAAGHPAWQRALRFQPAALRSIARRGASFEHARERRASCCACTTNS